MRNVDVATLLDIDAYVALATEAQEFLRSKNLAQWVPAAHPAHLPELRKKIANAALHKVTIADEGVAFFDLSFASPWWRDGRPAAYVSGIVVSRSHRGHALGRFILDWCCASAAAAKVRVLRLDCHAGNQWLCAYYRDYGFEEVARVEQHPGYVGVLFERRLN